MSRANEYKAKGGAFQDPSAAIGALDSLLEDVKKAGEKTSYHLDKEKKYRANVSGLQDCIWSVIRDSKEEWKKIGLDGSFVHQKEEVDKDKYCLKVLFEHPLYEYVWLTDDSGRNIVEELIPFLEYSIEYTKATNTVSVAQKDIEAKVNIPDLMSSFKTAGEDLLLLKTEAERVGQVVQAARDAKQKFIKAVEEFCGKTKLKIELNGDVQEQAKDVAKEENSKDEDKASAEADEDGEVVVDDMIVDDVNVEDMDMEEIDAELSEALTEQDGEAKDAAQNDETSSDNVKSTPFGKKSSMKFGRKPFGKAASGKKGS